MSQKVTRILWEDAWSNNSSWTEEEIRKQPPFLTESVGWLVYEDRRAIVLAQEARRGKHNADAYRHIQSIPKSLIRRRR